MSGDESSDAFDPAPGPSKRRRLSPPSPHSEEGDAFLATTKPKAAQRKRGRPRKDSGVGDAGIKSTKQKHRVHIAAGPAKLEDTYASQIAVASSSPYRIRGAIWQKPAAGPAAQAGKQGNSEQVEAGEDEGFASSFGVSRHSQSPTQIRGATGVGRIVNGTHNGNARLSAHAESSSDDEAFEPLASKHARAETPSNREVLPANSRLGHPDHEQENVNTAELQDLDIAKELEDLPADAFDSSPASAESANNVITISSQTSPARRENLAAPQAGLRQTTLFGQLAQPHGHASEVNKRHNWPLAQKDEPPTHHTLDHEALKTWVYPTNLGTIRDYQYSIVRNGLYNNILVALPTGLGKTFIAATIMLNWFRWTRDAKIVFVAPTKPLVSQQVEACFGIAGIPRSQTSMLTGGISPGLRAEEWEQKRVFFMTPQTIINDLKSGACDPKKIVLLVVDEAHRATGAYAYVEVVRFLRRFNQSFRVLALTATPGATVEAVQEVIDGLDIARVEIRTECSMDIREYVYSRRTDQKVFDNSEEMTLIMDEFSKAVQPVLSQLTSFNAYWTRDPMALTAYGLTQARAKWFASAGRHASAAQKGMVFRLFSVLASLAHSIELLKYHGLGPFYHGMLGFQNAQDAKQGGGKYETQILESKHFRAMMAKLRFWINNESFIGHPKLEYLQELVVNHFMDVGENSTTRVMIFAHYRDSAEEIVRVLNRSKPMVKAHVFVGQASSKGTEGMDQKKQLEVIQSFKAGTYNTLVATSIGEEGLDIGEIDLIICYDSSASPVRMLQRMGRTGRKRAGRIMLLLMRGKEEDSFAKAKDSYAKMQEMIASGTRFSFHDDKSPRIVPRDVEPEVDKRVVEIPEENTQGILPEPKKRGRAPKRPPKKFHMPDGVRTGFVRASRIDGDDGSDVGVERGPSYDRTEVRDPPADLVEVPRLEEIILTAAQECELERYQRIEDTGEEDVVITRPALGAHPKHQRRLRPTNTLRHGAGTKATVKMLQAMHAMEVWRLDEFERLSRSANLDELCGDVAAVSSEEPGPESEDEFSLPMPNPPRKTAVEKPWPRRLAATQDAMEAESSSPLRTSPRMQIQSQGISLGSETSGEDEAEDDPESELRDFVVDDDAEVGIDSAATLTSSLPLPETGRSRVQRSKSGSLASESDGDDDELPSVEDLIRNRAHCSGPKDNKRDSGVGGLVSPPRKRQRRVVEDSSDGD